MVTATPGSTTVICGYETVSSSEATFSVVAALSVVSSISVVLVVLVVVVDGVTPRYSAMLALFSRDLLSSVLSLLVLFSLALLLLALVLFSKSF